MPKSKLNHLSFACTCDRGNCCIVLDEEIEKISKQMKDKKTRLINPGLLFGDFICIEKKGIHRACFIIEDETGKTSLPARKRENKEKLVAASRVRMEDKSDTCVIFPVVTTKGKISLETIWIKKKEEETH